MDQATEAWRQGTAGERHGAEAGGGTNAHRAERWAVGRRQQVPRFAQAVVCALCGAYTASCRLANLSVACRGAPTPGGGATRQARLLARRPVVASATPAVAIAPTLLRGERYAGAEHSIADVARAQSPAAVADRAEQPGGSGHANGGEAVGAPAAAAAASGYRRGQMRPRRPQAPLRDEAPDSAAAWPFGPVGFDDA